MTSRSKLEMFHKLLFLAQICEGDPDIRLRHLREPCKLIRSYAGSSASHHFEHGKEDLPGLTRIVTPQGNRTRNGRYRL